MRAAVEVLLSLFAVLGLMSLSWLLYGHILSPAGGGRCCTLVPGRGDGAELEQAVRGLLWLRGGELLTGCVVIVDCGLNETGQAVAQALCRREPSVQVCTPERLPRYIREL